MGRRRAPVDDDAVKFSDIPSVRFSVFALADLCDIGRKLQRSDAVLHSQLISSLRRHGDSLITRRTFCKRWEAVLYGMTVTYDVGPGDFIMVVAVARKTQTVRPAVRRKDATENDAWPYGQLFQDDAGYS